MDKIALYQSFEDQTDAANCAPRVAALRAELKKRGLDGFLIPRADEHQGEYVPKRAERLAWLTAFTGSVAKSVITGCYLHYIVVFSIIYSNIWYG